MYGISSRVEEAQTADPDGWQWGKHRGDAQGVSRIPTLSPKDVPRGELLSRNLRDEDDIHNLVSRLGDTAHSHSRATRHHSLYVVLSFTALPPSIDFQAILRARNGERVASRTCVGMMFSAMS